MSVYFGMSRKKRSESSSRSRLCVDCSRRGFRSPKRFEQHDTGQHSYHSKPLGQPWTNHPQRKFGGGIPYVSYHSKSGSKNNSYVMVGSVTLNVIHMILND